MSSKCLIPEQVASIFRYSDTPDARPWWTGRGDFEVSIPRSGSSDCEASGDMSGEESSSTLGSLDCFHGDRSEKRAAQFTQYSMTSSVVPRSEG